MLGMYSAFRTRFRGLCLAVLFLGISAIASNRYFDFPIAKWVGQKFVVLAKQNLVRQFGYELYLTPECAMSKKKPDPDWEAACHHIRCDKLEGSFIIAKEVKPVGNDYLVKFEHEESGRAIFGKPQQGSLEGIALAVDLDSAQSKWLGKTIYSVRRFIDTFDSAIGSLGMIKVKIEQPLVVTGVKWGMTPLPPKPLWIEVKTERGEKGFIPTRISWTNTIADKKTDSAPWSEDIMDIDPKKVYSWDETMWETINKHSIATGMTTEQVRLSWGPPRSIVKSASNNSETWSFGDQSLVFVNDSLVSSGNR
jgi:hypothetical protein